jgi:hypothetical protein
VAIGLAGCGEILAEWRHEIGMIAISDLGPGGTMTEVQATAATGFSSPLHYAASSPGTLAGVSCIAFGLRGPTLNLTMAPEDGIPVALMMCAAWLERRAARFMVVATCRASGAAGMMSHAVLLAPPGFSGPGKPLTQSVVSWLAMGDTADGAIA